jgi:DNA-binding CsgD family transcriptional regulator/tetratricopeptide (TPR) repeat protein
VVKVVLLERESSLAALREYATEARTDGRLVLVAGEAGVGKSALVERLRLELPQANWWWGACDGLFTPRPLGPLFDLAEQIGGDLAELCRAGADRDVLFRTLLRQISPRETLDVVVIEDVHWADDATLDLVRFLGRRLRDARVLLIATYRDDALPADHPLRVVLGDLASQRYTRRIGLAPLSPQAVEVMASGSGLTAADLCQLTGGNPFYLTEVLRAGTSEVPVSARDAVLARAARLSSPARDVLDVAALTGNRVEAGLLRAVPEHTATDIDGTPALDELVTSGLLVPDGAGLRFRHEIARLAVAQAVPVHRAQAIHRCVLAARWFSDDARLAFHAEAAGDGAAVLRHAPAAARQAARLASHREAAAQYERALRFADGADPALVAELNQGFACEAALLDRWHEAEAAAERALALWRAAGDRAREGGMLRRLSRIRWNMCRGTEAFAAAEAAVSTLESCGPSVELAWAYATYANQRMLYGDHEAARELALRAQALAARLGATDVLSDATNTEAASRAAQDLDWEDWLRHALDLALAGGHHDQAARAYTNLCALYVDQRSYAEAERYLDEGIAFCDDHDIATYAACLRGERASLLERTGRWEEAFELCQELRLQAVRSPANRLCALIRLGAIASRRADPQVWTYLDEASALADATGEPQQHTAVRVARSEAYWLADRTDDARREAEAAADWCASLNAWQRGTVAFWLWTTGSPRTVPGEVAQPFRLLFAGDAEAAAQEWTRLGCRYEAALALASGTDESALREALTILTALGAPPAGRIVRQRLHALGARAVPTGPRDATRAHPLGLTRREREVLDLIRAAHTNAEIANKLVISPRTVDHHVSAILGKLGVPTRADAARRAAQLDVAAT